VKKPKIVTRRSTLAMAAGGTLILAGCGTASAVAATNPGTTHQTITLWESHSAGGPPGLAVAALVKQFNATHPDIQVALTVTKASHKALGALAAGDAPVAAWISHYDGQFLSAHALIDLNSLINGPSGLTAAERTSVFPVVWHNGEVNGQHYRLEVDAKISQLTYNKALFAKAGIAAPPTTWTQLATDVAILKQKLPGVIPLAWKDSSAHILPPFLSNGGQIFQPGSHEKKADFLTPAAVNTFTYFRNLYQKGEMILAHGSNIRADFGAGKLAIADGTSAGYQKILDAAHGQFPVGVFAYPAGSTGHTANLVQGLGFVLMVNHTKAQDQAAMTFVDWWFGAKAQAYWGTHSGYPPVDRLGLSHISQSYLASHPGVSVAVDTLESPYTISRPVPTAYKEVQAVLDTAFYNAVTGRTSVQSALNILETQANNYLSGNSAL
jgi:sn-glycerol 3-phosphate transport system substrate-binding protein